MVEDLTAHAITQAVWPSSVATARPLAGSQTLGGLLEPHDAGAYGSGSL